MLVRRLLLIDDDPEFQGLLESRLAPNGFEVVLPPDPTNPLGHVKELRPAIIIISVELPDKVGYALCNKAKKGLARDIPVILTTRSVPASGFRSHRKLKVHADEYIDKRAMTEQEVVSKVDLLVGIGESSKTGVEFDFEDMDVEELDMSDLVEDRSARHGRPPASLNEVSFELDDDDDEAVSAVPRQVPHEGGAEFDPRELGADADDDGSFDFGEPVDPSGIREIGFGRTSVNPFAGPQAGTRTLRGSNGERAQTATAVGTDPGPFPGGDEPGLMTDELVADPGVPELDLDGMQEFGPNEFEADRTAVAEAPSRPDLGASAGDAPMLGIEPEPSAPVADLDLGLDQVASQAETRRHETEPPPRTDELEREVERLRAELDEARRAPAVSSPFSREREFLNLREVINKKEKQLLDLDDQINTRERAILTEKDRVRDLERQRSGLDARNLEMEQNLLGANEELERLRGDRATWSEQLRRQTEAAAALRTDADALSRLLERERATWREERDALARRHEAAVAEAQQHHEAVRAALEESLREEHAGSLHGLKQSFEQSSAEKDKGFGAAMALAELRRQEELTAAHRAADDRMASELADARRRHQDEVEALRREQAGELEGLVRQSQEGRQALEDRQSAHIASLEEEQSQALTAAERRRVTELADADKRRVAELADADRRRLAELADADARRSVELAEVEARRRRDLDEAEEERVRGEAELRDRFASERAALLRQVAAERDDLERQLAERGREASERADELADAREALAARERTVESLHAMLAERDERLTRQRQEQDELERQNAGYQEQVLRAFQKIKTDEETVARAKKAMAIALTLLDEESAAARED
jgi:CheY-like chemotaxis protein